MIRMNGKRARTGAWLALCALLSGACAGSVQFRGQTPINVSGTLPPPPAPKRVEVREDQIVINEKIQFAYNESRILPQSFDLLNEVADTMKKHQELRKIEIGGHASSEGSDEYNLGLSERRAEAVRQYLVEKSGVREERLMSEGYGETKPLVAPDDSEAQRERNRRVEFVILERAKTSAELKPASD
jgi:OOP family OmpA-OmpF porin